MSEEERKSTIDCISSILISTGQRMTIEQLHYDFLNTVGYRIPYQIFGCDSVEHFLRTLKDKVQVFGSGPNAYVQVIVNEKTAHINDLISRQKTRYHRYHTRRRFYSNPKNSRTSVRYEHRNQLHNRLSVNISHDNVVSETLENISPAQVSETVENISAAAHSESPLKNTQDISELTHAESPTNVQNISEFACAESPPENVQDISELDDVYFSEDESQDNVKIPQIIQDNLKKLIINHPDGIWSSHLLPLYKKQFGKCLWFDEYGYRSVAQMCADLRNIFTVVQLDSSDVKLFDKNIPIPKGTLNIILRLQLMKMKATAEAPACNAIPELTAEELMGDYYIEKTPPDIVQFGTVLEQQWIDPGTNEQDYLDVNIGEIYDPSKFWLNLRLYAYQLNALMDKMQDFYAVYKNDLLVPYYGLRNGLYIACIFSNEYHRGKIVNASQKNERLVKVYFIDHGTVSMIFIDSICYLHSQFSELPGQAIRARLAGIYPPTENEQWSRVAASRFLDLVMQKDLVAQLIKIDEEQKIVDIVLADTTEPDEDFFINDALIHMGYALFTFQPRYEEKPTNIVPIVRYIHLFPTFDELESGLVPTASQMITMHHAGVSIEQAYPHYFKDTKTGLPITVNQLSPTGNHNVPVDGANNQTSAITEVQCVDDVSDANISTSAACNWGDVLDKSELNSTVDSDTHLPSTVDVEGSTEKCMHDISIQTNSEDEMHSKDEASTESNILVNPDIDNVLTHQATQVDCSNEDYHEINNIQTSKCTSSTQTNESSKVLVEETIKKPIRPPPGYGPIPENVIINYNNTGTTNYLTTQTYLNMPIEIGCYNLAHQDKHILYMTYLNALAMRGIPLTPEQHNHYLQNLFVGINSNPLLGGCRYESPINAQYAPFYNQNACPVFSSCENAATCPPQLNVVTNPSDNAVGNNNSKNSSINTSEISPENQSMSNTVCSPDKVQAETKDLKGNVSISNQKVQAKQSEEPLLHELVNLKIESKSHNTPETTKCENQLQVNAISNLDISSIDQQNLQNNTKANSRGNIETSSERNAVENLESHNLSASLKSSIFETSTDSNYEECGSDYLKESWNKKRHDIVDFQEKISSHVKFIRKYGSTTFNLHIINYDGYVYFLLDELSQKLFGMSLTVTQIRRLFVGSPHTISILDIRLKTNPELKKELLLYKLIKEEELTVDAISISHLRNMTEIIPNIKKPENLDEILKEIELLL